MFNEIKSIETRKSKEKEYIIFNCEQIPGESMAVRLADIDYILGYNRLENVGEQPQKKYELYSNQYISLTDDASIYDRITVQGEFDSLTSGGAILHLNVDDEKPISPEQFKKLMIAAKEMKTVYFAINYAYSECAGEHFIIGKHDQCTVCEKPIIQQYTRVVGFITPVKSWNGTRRDYEYKKRVFYRNGALNIETLEDKEKIKDFKLA